MRLCGRLSVKWIFLICGSRREWVGEQSFRIMRRRWSRPILRVFSRDDDVAGARPRDARLVASVSGEETQCLGELKLI